MGHYEVQKAEERLKRSMGILKNSSRINVLTAQIDRMSSELDEAKLLSNKLSEVRNSTMELFKSSYDYRKAFELSNSLRDILFSQPSNEPGKYHALAKRVQQLPQQPENVESIVNALQCMAALAEQIDALR